MGHCSALNQCVLCEKHNALCESHNVLCEEAHCTVQEYFCLCILGVSITSGGPYRIHISYHKKKLWNIKHYQTKE